MKWLASILASWALLLAPTFGWAVDGDNVGVQTTKGAVTVQKIILCDSDTANSTCTVFDQNTIHGVPDAYNFLINEDEDCTAFTVTISASSLTDGDLHTVTVLAFGGTTSIYVPNPLLQFIHTVSTNEADCTDLDVIMEMYYFKD